VFFPRSVFFVQLRVFQGVYLGVHAVTGTEARNRANACFFLKKHVSSFERFLSEYKRSINKLISALVLLFIVGIRGERLRVHGAFLLAEDTTFARKAGKKMPGVQKWKDHSSSPDRGGYILGHNRSILGLLFPFSGRWFCFPIMARLIPGQKNPSHFVSTPEGLRPANFLGRRSFKHLIRVGITWATGTAGSSG